MNDGSRNVLAAIVGAYLVYTGGSLIMDVISEQPDNMVLFIVMGAIFIVVGGWVVITKLKKSMVEISEQQEESEVEEKSNEEEFLKEESTEKESEEI